MISETQLSKMNQKKILIVGDIGLDEYANGSVRRISPEAPVPVVEVDKEELRLGLATNVAQNVLSLGGVPLLVSVVGSDSAGETLCGLLKEQKISDKYIVKDNARRTTRKLRVMSEHHHVVRVDFEQKKFLSPEIQKRILNQVTELITEAQGLILQDYAKGMLSENLIQDIINLAHKHKVFVIVDPYRTTPIHYYRGADLMTPNSEEAILLSKIIVDELHMVTENYVEVGEALMNGIGSTQMVITRGKDGMTLFENNNIEHVPTFAREVFDVTGAGDTVVAALALAWSSGFSLKESCLLANHAAGVVVGKVGCVPCSREELAESLKST